MGIIGTWRNRFRSWTIGKEPPLPKSRPKMLKYMAARLSGTGIEFGAGASPFPVASNCTVRYADRNSVATLREREYFGDRALVNPDLITDLEEMAGIQDTSLDFIVASHVIEHTRNPLLTFRQAYLKLRRGGRLALIIPDKVATFDKERPLTELEHLILDYTDPSRERDFEHYVEFFEKSFPQPDPAYAARRSFDRGDDIHFHTWTYESFARMVSHSKREISPWSDVWSHPRLSESDIEFYYILTR